MQYVKILAGRPQLYEVPADAVELTPEQAGWMLARPNVVTIEEILSMQEAPPPPPTLQELKAVKMAALNNWNAQRIAAGYIDPDGRTWGIADEDRRAWNELATAIMLSEMEAGDLVPSMREKSGVTVHTGITVAECREILKGIARAYMQIDAEYAALRAAIVNADSESVLESIVFL